MDTEITSDIRDLLNHLGLTPNYLGHYYTAYALSLTKQQPERLLLITKWLYPDIAKHYHTKWSCVERNLRAAVAIVWLRNPALLEQLAGYPLPHKPTASQFIAILHAHLYRSHAA